MSSPVVTSALAVLAPISRSTADSTFGKGFMREASSTTQVDRTIPSAWLNQWVTFKAVSQGTDYAITRSGDTKPTLTYGKASPLNAQDPGAAWPLAAGESERVYIPGDAVTLSFISAATGGQFVGRISTARNFTPVP